MIRRRSRRSIRKPHSAVMVAPTEIAKTAATTTAAIPTAVVIPRSPTPSTTTSTRSPASWNAAPASAAATLTRPPVRPARTKRRGLVATSTSPLGCAGTAGSATPAASAGGRTSSCRSRRARSHAASAGGRASMRPSALLPPTTSMRSSSTPRSRWSSGRRTSTDWMRSSGITRRVRLSSPLSSTSSLPVTV